MEIKGYTNVNDFTNAILEEAEVALVTGAGFGAPENIRLYATDLDTLKEAVRRIKSLYGKNRINIDQKKREVIMMSNN